MGTTTEAPARPAAAAIKVNSLGLDRNAYKGAPSTLCKGCGHDTIGQRIINVAWDLGLDQTQVVKMSGIGCSSKSPAYFMGWSHAFNGVHGRMPAIATGAAVANRDLTIIGISGDGDTACLHRHRPVQACGAPQRPDALHRGEQRHVYGLTKGQFSATNGLGQRLKYAGVNNLPPLDICLEALAANATFVARSFAGDLRQVETLLKAAFSHRGIAVLDIISPCVTFNNHDDSSKSYTWGKRRNRAQRAELHPALRGNQHRLLRGRDGRDARWLAHPAQAGPGL